MFFVLQSDWKCVLTAEAPFSPSDIGLILTYQCHSACAHCLYNCGPGWHDWMTEHDILSALDVIQNWGHPDYIHITGGEPFLNFPLLLQTVQAASQRGIRCYVETNAEWCQEDAVVQECFEALRAAGLLAILISCSPFHAVAIPLIRTLRAIALAMEIFGPHRVIVYLPEFLELIIRFSKEERVPLERYLDAYGEQPAGLMFWDGYSLIPGGRSGYRLGNLTLRQPATAFAEQNCRQEILFAPVNHFDPYGNFIPGYCSGLSLGDWHEFDRVRSNYLSRRLPPIIERVVSSGPYGLLTFAQNFSGYHELAGGYVGKCHLCVDVRKTLATSGAFPELSPTGFYRAF